MGNQSTSGIVEEAKATNEAPKKWQEVITSPDELKEENQKQVQEDETGDFQEKSGEEGTVNDDCETLEANESNSGEGRSKFKNEEQNEVSYDSRGEVQNPNPECTSTFTVLRSEPHEKVTADITSEHQEDQRMLAKETVEIDHHDVEEKENVFVVACRPCDEAAVSDMCPDEAECAKNDEHLEEEQSASLSNLNDVQSICSLESCAAESGDQNQLPDQEISQFLIRCNDDPSKMIIKENGEECEVDIDSHCGLEKDGLLDEVKKVDEGHEKAVEEVEERGRSITQEDEEFGDESILEKSVKEAMDTAGLIAQENEELGDECILKKAVEEVKENEVLGDENILEKVVLKECVRNEHEESRESVGFGSKNSVIELKKCPSFDFGVSFNKQTEESDQTPLLYQDKTARRSVSSCSNLRFETEYVAKYEAVKVQEKTIRMERSNSESINKQNTVSKIQETSLKASPSSKDDASLVLERANAKRKPRSSLFTTCICCTAAIN